MPLKACPICCEKEGSYERTINKIDLLRCGFCGFVYVNLGDEEIRQANSACADDFSSNTKQRQNVIDQMWFELVARKIKKAAGGGNILDIGCGNGMLLRHFLSSPWSAYGLDFSPWAREFSQLYGYKLIECELERADFPANYFDVIASTSTLEHIPQPLCHVKEVMRLLKPGGVAYFSGIPNYGAWSVRLGISEFYRNRPPRHVNYFTCATMHQLFSNPEIATNVKMVSISTYGIPELHRMYYSLREIFRGSKGEPEKGYEKRGESLGREKGPQEGIGRKAGLLMMATLHALGRPFNSGDKLEVIAVKQ